MWKQASVFVALLLLCGCITPPASENKNVPNSLLSVARQLREKGIMGEISDEKFALVLDGISSGRLNSTLDILISIGKILVFKENSTDLASIAGYPSVYDKLRSLNDEVQVESFNISFLKVENETNPIISFVFDGTKYETMPYYSERFLVDVSGCYMILNRVLADKASSYRFYGIYFCKEYKPDFCTVDFSKDGVISLTKEQATFLYDSKLLHISLGSHNILSTKELTSIVDGFKGAGFFDHLDEHEFLLEKKNLFMKVPTSNMYILEYFSNVTYWFDTETSNFENPYEEITLGLSDISHGNFVPGDILDSFAYNEASNFSFTLFGKKYASVLETSGDWLDISFINLINSALEENGVEGRFYILGSGIGQDVLVIYVDEAQLNFLRSKGIKAIAPGESNAVGEGKAFEDFVVKSYTNGSRY